MVIHGFASNVRSPRGSERGSGRIFVESTHRRPSTVSVRERIVMARHVDQLVTVLTRNWAINYIQGLERIAIAGNCIVFTSGAR